MFHNLSYSFLRNLSMKLPGTISSKLYTTYTSTPHQFADSVIVVFPLCLFPSSFSRSRSHLRSHSFIPGYHHPFHTTVPLHRSLFTDDTGAVPHRDEHVCRAGRLSRRRCRPAVHLHTSTANTHHCYHRSVRASSYCTT